MGCMLSALSIHAINGDNIDLPSNVVNGRCVELFRTSYLELAFFFIHWNNHGLMTYLC